jgi:hypothetical protein
MEGYPSGAKLQHFSRRLQVGSAKPAAYALEQLKHMKFECDFADPHDRSQQITVAIELTPDEVRVLRMLHRERAPQAELTAHAMVLKHGYQQAPAGYQHVQGGIRQVEVN